MVQSPRAKRDSQPSNVQKITLIILCGDWLLVILIILPAHNAKPIVLYRGIKFNLCLTVARTPH